MTINKARKDFDRLISLCLEHNDVFTIETKNGDVIMLSEEKYKSLIESLYLYSKKGILEDIKETLNTKTNDFSKNYPWR